MMADLSVLEDAIADDFPALLDSFGLDMKNVGHYWKGVCVFHGGDNPTALCVDLEKRNWKCYTHGCHRKTVNTLIGFARMCLTKPGCSLYSFLSYDKILTEVVFGRRYYV